MTALALVLILLVTAAAVLFLAVYAKRLLDEQAASFAERLREQDEAEEGRRVALYKQQKQMHRTVTASDRAVRKLADETRSLHENTRLLHERTDQHFADPRVKRVLGEG